MILCAPIQKKTTGEVIKAVKAAQQTVEMVEIWFDEITDLTEKNLNEIFSHKTRPILYKYQGNEKNLETLLNYPIDLIDFDFTTTPKKLLKKIPAKIEIILSHHDFNATPSTKTLEKLAKKMRKSGADIIKIATTAQSITDSVRLLQFLYQTSRTQKSICLAMGQEGEITRSAGHLFGNYLMYAPISKSDLTASGQLLASELIEIRKLTH